MDTEKMNAWGLGDISFLHIAGPCSAESEEQIMSIAEGLHKVGGVNLFRAGIWKPRTRPGAFEGHGEKALKWLVKAKEKYGFKTCCEVAKPAHVERALQYGVDVLWIGARTSGNPFSVQAIAEALAGKNVPVLVKNPMHPDLSLWIGAIERLQAKGITRIGAIHRGFSSYEKTKYRNMPGWHIPLAFMRTLPDIPMIIDPSHITGNPMLIQKVTQRGINFGADGVMIEVHTNPEQALTDAEQQITPTQYKLLIEGLKIGIRLSTPIYLHSQLHDYRRAIDELDSLLISTLADRMGYAKLIGIYKADNNILPLQMERWTEVLASRIKQGKHKGISSELIMNIYEMIHQESLKVQSRALLIR